MFIKEGCVFNLVTYFDSRVTLHLCHHICCFNDFEILKDEHQNIFNVILTVHRR